MNETPEEKFIPRKPVNPKQIPQSATGVKKGKSSWKPASLNEFTNKEEGFRYRMSRKDAGNLSKKQQEGWENVNGLSGQNTKHEAPGRVNDGMPLTSTQEGHDWVLQRIPEEIALERDAFYNNETERRVAGLTAHVKRDMQEKGGNAPVHGDITISSRKGTETYE